MTILVIGKSGQIARALLERAGEYSDICALGRPELDLTDLPSLDRAIDTLHPSVLINAAAYTAVDKAESEKRQAFAVNEAGPRALAKLCQVRKIPLIHYSTDYVFDGHKSAPYDEDDPTSPVSAYGRSKLAGEQAIASEMDNFLILRTAWVYSPFGSNFVKTMLRLASDREEVDVVADQWGCPSSAMDIADATLSMAEVVKAGGQNWGIYNVAAPDATNWHGLAEAVFEVLAEYRGARVRANAISSRDYPTKANRPYNSRLGSSKLERDWSLRLPAWRNSVEDCVKRLVIEGSRT